MKLPRMFYVLFVFVLCTLTIVFTSYHNLSIFDRIKTESDPLISDNKLDKLASDDNVNEYNESSWSKKIRTKFRKNALKNNSKHKSSNDLHETIETLQTEISNLRLRLDQMEQQYSPSSMSKMSGENRKKLFKFRQNFQDDHHSKYAKIKFLPYAEKKRILITGGAGFVGSHLLDRLLSDGHEVIVADNFHTGRRSNIEHWLGHPNFELLHHDIVNPLYVEVDEIYHLASPASPPHYMINAVKTIKTNTMGTINMLGLAKRVGARILVASTSEIYGDPGQHPQSESYWGNVNPIGPRSCYDEGKRVAEALTYAYAKQENLDVRVARIFNTYGPRMHVNDGRVVSNFISQALQNEPLTIYGQGMQTRSFQYVTDLVDGLVRLMGSNYTRPVNLGNPEEHTIKDFARIIWQLVQAQPKSWSPNSSSSAVNTMIKHLPAQPDDPQRRKPDITLARKVLNWYPNITLIDGLGRTIDYFRLELKHSLGEHP